MTSVGTVISYPIPAYSNLPIEPQFYQPSVFEISAISFGYSTTVTTLVNHNYVIGQQIRLLIPPGDGCTNLNNLVGYVLDIPADNQVIVSINSIGSNTFINNNTQQNAQILAVGDINQGQTNSTGLQNQSTFVPGSFINISPV